MSTITSSNSHAAARDVVQAAWQKVHGRAPTTNELLMTLAIAHLETGYGRFEPFGSWAQQGKFNWGALERARLPDGSCPAGTEPGSDAGNARCFYVYGSDAAAAEQYIHNLTDAKGITGPFAERRTGTLAAMATGDPQAVSHAMKTPASVAYFEADPTAYGNVIASNLKTIQTALSLPLEESPGAWSWAKAAAGVVLVGVAGVLAASLAGVKVPLPALPKRIGAFRLPRLPRVL